MKSGFTSEVQFQKYLQTDLPVREVLYLTLKKKMIMRQLAIQKKKTTHHGYPGAGSDPGHIFSLPVGCLPLRHLEAVQSGREVVQQTLSL